MRRPTKNSLVYFRKVVANNADEIHVGKEAGGGRRNKCGAPMMRSSLPVRLSMASKRDGAYDEQGHGVSWKRI